MVRVASTTLTASARLEPRKRVVVFRWQRMRSLALATARLDWIWGRLSGGHRSIDGIKIDVQGMAIEALEGMTGVLRAFTPRLVVEIHHGVDRRTLFDLLERVGYSREGEPVEPAPREATPLYLDDRSYAFSPLTRVVSDAR